MREEAKKVLRGTPFFFGVGTTLIKRDTDRHGESHPDARFDSFGFRIMSAR